MNRRDRAPQPSGEVGKREPLRFLIGAELHGKNFAHGEVSRKEKFRRELVHSLSDVTATLGMEKTLHLHIKAHRKLRKLTQEHIANILGISHNAFSEKERGIKPLTLEEVEKIAEALGLHPIALLMAPTDGPRADLIRRAAEIARTRSPQAAEAWLQSGEHIPEEGSDR